jgi:hypothetical protein
MNHQEVKVGEMYLVMKPFKLFEVTEMGSWPAIQARDPAESSRPLRRRRARPLHIRRLEQKHVTVIAPTLVGDAEFGTFEVLVDGEIFTALPDFWHRMQEIK